MISYCDDLDLTIPFSKPTFPLLPQIFCHWQPAVCLSGLPGLGVLHIPPILASPRPIDKVAWKLFYSCRLEKMTVLRWEPAYQLTSFSFALMELPSPWTLLIRANCIQRVIRKPVTSWANQDALVCRNERNKMKSTCLDSWRNNQLLQALLETRLQLICRQLLLLLVSI